jgi:hypothetical protein
MRLERLAPTRLGLAESLLCRIRFYFGHGNEMWSGLVEGIII